MSWLSRLRDDLRPIPAPEPRAAASPRPAVAGVARTEGGRLSVDTAFSYFGTPSVIVPPMEAEDSWHVLHLDAGTLGRMSPGRLLYLLADLSPDVSRALWDFLRLCNPGWEFTVTRPGSETPDAAGTAAVQSFLDTLSDLYGSVDVLWGRLFISAFLRGALMAELVLDEAGRLPLDLAIPDPASVRFKSVQDPLRGIVWQLGQWQNRPVAENPGFTPGFMPLDRPTIRYLPIDPFPGSPYGRGMASPALFSTLFLLGMLHDLRRVISQQGYPRLDAVVDLPSLMAAAPQDIVSDPVKWKAWIDATIDEVITAYKCLQPDDLFVHTNVVTINRPIGTIDHHSLGSVGTLIEALERQAVRALKTMPFMMASTQSTTETQANREWEVQAAGIKSIQHHAETLLGRLLGLALQAQGIAGVVTFRFAELRAAEMFRDAQTEALMIDNAFRKYAYGAFDMNELAQAISGHDATAPEPRIVFKGENTAPAKGASTDPEPGANRTVPLRVVGDGP